jgi:hypothetical protein
MKNIKTILKLTTFVLAVSLSFSAKAQIDEKATSVQIADSNTDFVVSELDLDATKAKDLKSINEAYANKMRELMSRGTGASEKEVEALKRSHTNKIRSILDVEEYEKYLLMTAKMKKEKEAKANMKSKQ